MFHIGNSMLILCRYFSENLNFIYNKIQFTFYNLYWVTRKQIIVYKTHFSNPYKKKKIHSILSVSSIYLQRSNSE